MLDLNGALLYVGKAKNLKKRINQYFKGALDTKTACLVSQVHSIEVTITRNEREALLLENNLIKSKKPRYNILFRDDKSYPFLKLSTQESFPRLSIYRGKKKKDAQYFGPYPNSPIAREALHMLQNIFQLRQCNSVFFRNRTRPCLQFQIKRCSAPCVDLISPEAYAQDVQNAALFLSGKNQSVLQKLTEQMESASQSLDFEKAGRLRDQIAVLRHVQTPQIVVGDKENVDILGIAHQYHQACIYQLRVRDGQMLAGHAYLLLHQEFITETENNQALLENFILQHYMDLGAEHIPQILITPLSLKQQSTIQAILSDKAGKKIQIIHTPRGDRLRWQQMAHFNAESALKQDLKKQLDYQSGFEELQKVLPGHPPLQHIVCMDVSHTLGEATVLSAVVFNPQGPLKSSYRRFNIRINSKGDDCAALREGLQRYGSALKLNKAPVPDLLIVDGGRAQLKCAQQVLENLTLQHLPLLSIAKGLLRKPGLETIYARADQKIVILKPPQIVFRLLLQLRDEAHRFAIGAHRQLRRRARSSILETIPGIGPKRRTALLKHFGGLTELLTASAEALAQVPGVHHRLAQEIYTSLRNQS